jgi:hypothetical protein
MTLMDWSKAFLIPIPVTDWSVYAFLLLMIALGLFGVFSGLYAIYGGQPGPKPRQTAMKGGVEIAAAAICLMLLRSGIVDAGWLVVYAVLISIFLVEVYFKWSNSRNPFKADEAFRPDKWAKTRAKGRTWFVLPFAIGLGLGGAWPFAFLKVLFWDYIPLFIGPLVIIAFTVWGYWIAATAWTENESKYLEPASGLVPSEDPS